MKAIDIVRPALLAALTAALAYIIIPLPFSPVPVTLQTLGVMLAGVVLTPHQAALAMGVYVLLGAIGAPIFSGGTAGLGTLLGPAGGYLVGFVPGAALIAIIRGNDGRITRLTTAVITGGLLAIYLPGTLWLSYVTGMGFTAALTVGTLPYIPGDLLKALAAIALGNRLKHTRFR
ncbi:MAG: biotin transporter BioY [Firmicutes bacterium]|nr:biotin transporter BioY [Bacillota bacterium]